VLRLRIRKEPEQTCLYSGNSEDPRVPSRGNNLEVRTIRREGRSTRSEPSETARRAPTQGASDDDTVHAPWRHGEHVNKVSVGEPADGSPPKEPSVRGGLGKVERASATRSRASNPLIFCIKSLGFLPPFRHLQYTSEKGAVSFPTKHSPSGRSDRTSSGLCTMGLSARVPFGFVRGNRVTCSRFGGA